jgi:hypothetical protein
MIALNQERKGNSERTEKYWEKARQKRRNVKRRLQDEMNESTYIPTYGAGTLNFQRSLKFI